VRNNKPGSTKALLKIAEDMRRVGILDAAVHEKITLRHLGGGARDSGEADQPATKFVHCGSRRI
jgi:hypothetical protein